MQRNLWDRSSQRIVRCLLAVSVALGGSALVGCASSDRTGRYEIVVALGAGMADPESGRVPSVEVDVVGVGPTQEARWREYRMSQYFGGGDTLRQSAPKATLPFTTDNPGAKTVERDDPVWDQWEQAGATRLFVLVNLPGFGESDDLSGEADGRRLILPLERARWAGRRIEIEVRPRELVCLTPLRAEKR